MWGFRCYCLFAPTHALRTIGRHRIVDCKESFLMRRLIAVMLLTEEVAGWSGR